jgi:hypothetical protein
MKQSLLSGTANIVISCITPGNFAHLQNATSASWTFGFRNTKQNKFDNNPTYTDLLPAEKNKTNKNNMFVVKNLTNLGEYRTVRCSLLVSTLADFASIYPLKTP